MANDWIKMRVDLHTDRSVIVMASSLKMSPDEVVGKLLRVWAWADKESVDGCVPLVPASYVDTLADCKKFAAAMESVGWLEDTDAGLRIPRFDRHNGESAKKRAIKAEEQRRRRKREGGAPRRQVEAPDDPTPHPTREGSSEPTHRPTLVGSRVGSAAPTAPPTREEKRREEKNYSSSSVSTQLSACAREGVAGGSDDDDEGSSSGVRSAS